MGKQKATEDDLEDWDMRSRDFPFVRKKKVLKETFDDNVGLSWLKEQCTSSLTLPVK